MKTIKELKEERAALAARMSQMLDVAEEREAKGFTAEERAKYDGLKKEYETLDERIALREEDEARAAASARRIGGDAGKTAEERAARHQEELRSTFIDYVRGAVTKPDIKEEMRAELFTGTADNQVIIPKLIADKVVHALKSTGTFLESIDLVITESAIPYTKSTLNTTDKALKKLAEGDANTTDKVKFEGVSFSAYDYVTPIFPIHIALLEGTSVDVEATIVEAVTQCVSRGLQELATRTGTGTNDIKALLTAATKGFTSAEGTAVTYDELVSLMSSVDNAYGNTERGAFMMNTATLAAVMKIADKNGRRFSSPTCRRAPSRASSAGRSSSTSRCPTSPPAPSRLRSATSSTTTCAWCAAFASPSSRRSMPTSSRWDSWAMSVPTATWSTPERTR